MNMKDIIEKSKAICEKVNVLAVYSKNVLALIRMSV